MGRHHRVDKDDAGDESAGDPNEFVPLGWLQTEEPKDAVLVHQEAHETGEGAVQEAHRVDGTEEHGHEQRLRKVRVPLREEVVGALVERLGLFVGRRQGGKHVPFDLAADVEKADDGRGDGVGQEHRLDRPHVVRAQDLGVVPQAHQIEDERRCEPPRGHGLGHERVLHFVRRVGRLHEGDQVTVQLGEGRVPQGDEDGAPDGLPQGEAGIHAVVGQDQAHAQHQPRQALLAQVLHQPPVQVLVQNRRRLGRLVDAEKVSALEVLVLHPPPPVERGRDEPHAHLVQAEPLGPLLVEHHQHFARRVAALGELVDLQVHLKELVRVVIHRRVGADFLKESLQKGFP
mmetsp:Transcript_68905/g.155885  ORF Transcript_68905/g.155885 Transcript_68905/m.155885 type:complete len:344 (-) Transcript_68905:702-1733(-)